MGSSDRRAGRSVDEALGEVGVGLAVAVLIDVTIVRGVLLPSVMTLCGDANWYLPGVRRRRAERAALTPDPRRA